jgi:adenylate cyclase
VNRRTRRLRSLLLVGAALLVVGAGLALLATHALRKFEYSTVDMRFSIRGRQPQPKGVAVVAVDDKTFSEPPHPHWPFARRLHAKVIDNLHRAGAAAIAYDVQFTEATDPTDDNDLIVAVRKARNVVLATTEVAKGGKTNIFGGSGPNGGLSYSRGIPSDSNYQNDSDGRIRHVAFRIQDLTTFPLAAAGEALGHPVKTPRGNGAWIDYPGPPGSIERLSFGDVLHGNFPASAVRGRVVVVGATAPSLQDLHPTSTTGSGLMPGPEIQAAAAWTALEGFPIRDDAGWINVLTVVVLGALAPLLALRRRILLAIGAGVLAIAALLVGAQVAFNDGTVLTIVPALAAGVGALAATAAIHGVTVAFEREHTREAFARFVPEAVVDEVLRSADGLRLGGVQREGTVMFSDLRGFTSFSETLSPAQVIGALNQYLTAMSEAILDNGGTLVAYMGDGIMAVFGAPLQQDDHADRGLAAARDMLRRLEGFNEWLRQEGLHQGFKMGIGLNSGPVMSGHVGSERRLEYTALGDTTNTAARLEGMTKGTPHQLYVAETTRSALIRPVDDLIDAGEFEVRGRKAKVRLWSLPPEGEVMPDPADAAKPAGDEAGAKQAGDEAPPAESTTTA